MSTNRNLSLLPADFPANIVITVREGVHLRQVQWWAPYEFDGKNYKLIINPPRRQSIAAGEEWEVYPEHSPNGHIIFCHASRRLKTASGQHPFVARTAEHVRNHWVVEITPRFRTDWLWKRGPLESVRVSGDTVYIVLTDQLTDQVYGFACPVYETEFWRNRRNPESGRFGGDCEVGGKRYFVHFTDDAE